MTDAEMQLNSASVDASTVLRLDIETLYVLTTTLLDFLAKATQYYFGPDARQAGRSFSSLQKHLLSYAERKGLPAPSAEMADLARDLWQHVGKFRADYVSHKDERSHLPRTSMGLSCGPEFSNLRLHPSTLYPTGTDLIEPSGKAPDEIIEMTSLY